MCTLVSSVTGNIALSVYCLETLSLFVFCFISEILTREWKLPSLEHGLDYLVSTYLWVQNSLLISKKQSYAWQQCVKKCLF